MSLGIYLGIIILAMDLKYNCRYYTLILHSIPGCKTCESVCLFWNVTKLLLLKSIARIYWQGQYWVIHMLTHWGRVPHLCVSKLTIIGSGNGLSPGRRQTIIWSNVGIILTGPLGTNVIEIVIKIHTFSFKKMRVKMSSENVGHLVSASMC